MLLEKLKIVPNNPGCYLMHNKKGDIIYVGKAKNLKKRLNSYFNKKHTGKTALLVNEIVDFEYIITNTEVESLVLEINLIKKNNPYYNILLKDDKTYPYIEITNEKVPRVIVTRIRNFNKKNKSIIFGPYPNVYAARNTVNLLNRIYPFRKCISIPKKVCLYYHIGECLGYCEDMGQTSKIDEMKNEITRFLKGEHTIVTNIIKEKMNKSIEALNFEKAAEYKELLEYITVTLDRQKVNLNDFVDRDIFGYYEKDNYISIQIFFIRGGILNKRESLIVPLIDDVSDTLNTFIGTFYENNIKPKEVFVPDIMDTKILSEVLNMTVVTPKIGEKRKLLELAISNAQMSLEKEIELVKRTENKTEKASTNIGNMLGIENLSRIEIFDNSNLFGSFSVSGMVVFINGKKSPKNYRKFKISVEKNDDYHMMYEVIYRRYFRLLMEKKSFPDLIIVDGGKNQINAAKTALSDINVDIKVVGLKKDDKHSTNVLLDSDCVTEIKFDKHSNEFLLLTKMQDEVHNFVINYHRQLRSKSMSSSILDDIKGLGNTRKKELMMKFGTISKIKEASIEELNKILPMNVCEELVEKLNKN